MRTQRWHVGLLVLNAIFRHTDVYHTDVNIICHAKNVIKYVGINIFRQYGAFGDICLMYFANCEMGPLLKYHECNMNYDILSNKYPYIYLLTTLQWNTLNSMEPIDMYVVTKWSLFIKKITVAYQVKEQNYSLNDFPSVKYNH